MESALSTAEPRARVGSYRLFDEIARDPLGVTYLACPAGARSFPKWAALRRMHQGVARDTAMIHAFFAATQAAVRMVHRNIATTFDFGGKLSLPWSAREHLSGVSVVDVVNQLAADRAQLPWAVAIHMVAEAAEGVAALRARLPDGGPKTGFLTGTPAPNIFITRGGEVKIKDGCLPLLDGKPLVDSAALPYLPHEAPTGHDAWVGRRDAFALGALLWELVAGRRLFVGSTDDETLRLIEARVVPSLRAAARTPTMFDDVVERALGGSAGGLRPFANAAEIASELRAALVSQGKRVSASDISRIVGEMFAGRLAEEETRLQRAWAEEQALQASGDLEPDSASDTQVMLQNSDTLRDVTGETSSASFTRLRPRGVGFDEVPTIPRNDQGPPSSETPWRPVPAAAPAPVEPTPPPHRRTRPLLELSPQTMRVPEAREASESAPRGGDRGPGKGSTKSAPEASPLPPAPLPLHRSSPLPPAVAPRTAPQEPAVIVLATPPRAFVLPPVERGISQLGNALPPARVEETPLPEASLAALRAPASALPPTVKGAAQRERERAAATELVALRTTGTSPLLVGGVAFGLSFLAIGIFGASRRAASDGPPAPLVALSSEPAGGRRAVVAPPPPSTGMVTHPADDAWAPVPSAHGSPVGATTPEPPPPATHPAPVVAPPSHPGPAPARLGLITVFCTPACDDVVDGSHSLGPSPVFKVPASVGAHRLRLKVGSAEKRVTVSVTENETTVVREAVGD